MLLKVVNDLDGIVGIDDTQAISRDNRSKSIKSLISTLGMKCCIGKFDSVTSADWGNHI